MSDESAAQCTPKQMGQINKELSTLQPVVDALRILSEQRQEVWHGRLFLILQCMPVCISYNTVRRQRAQITRQIHLLTSYH